MRDFMNKRKTAGKGRVSANPPGRLQSVVEEKVSNYKYFDHRVSEIERYIEVDVTDLENLHETIDRMKEDFRKQEPPSYNAIESRNGLPYEQTDFNPSEEESEDLWDQAIVGSHIVKAKARRSRNRQDPGEGGKEVERIQGPPTPRARANEHFSQLIREKVSADGGMIIDTTDINDEDIDAMLNPTSGEGSSQMQTQPESSDPTRTSQADDIRDDGNEKDGNYFTCSLGYLQSFASGINLQLQKLPELIPVKEMDEMLGVLGKDLKETSQTMPEQRDEIVLFFGEQIEKGACGIDRSAGEHGQDLSVPVEALYESVKKTYSIGTAELEKGACGIDRFAGEHGQDFSLPVEALYESVKKTYSIGKEELEKGACGIDLSAGHGQEFALPVEALYESVKKTYSGIGTAEFSSFGVKKEGKRRSKPKRHPQTFIVPVHIRKKKVHEVESVNSLVETKCE
jgi:hypothetical protein